MALGKQGGIAKAPTLPPKESSTSGKKVGGGMRAEGVKVKPISGNSKKPR